MRTIDHFNLRSFDLNLLLAFDALMQDRSVTRAAERLKVRQPAMSHALGNLRLLLQDELFVRSGQSMRPTARAEALAEPIRKALEQTQLALFLSDQFDPRRQTRTFRIGVSAEMELLLLPALMARLRREAPGVSILARPATRQGTAALLDQGAIDLAIGCFEALPGWSRRRALFEETHLCCFSPTLTGLEAPISEADYLTRPHALVSLKDSLSGCLEDALSQAGVQLNVVAAAPNFLSIVAMAATAPLVATLPARVATRLAGAYGLAASPPPVALASFSVALAWHARLDNDAGSRWLRDLLCKEAATLSA